MKIFKGKFFFVVAISDFRDASAWLDTITTIKFTNISENGYVAFWNETHSPTELRVGERSNVCLCCVVAQSSRRDQPSLYPAVCP
jgi:hypothetical protein